MKQPLFALLAFLALSIHAFSQENRNIDTDIEMVKVHLRGAEVIRTKTVTLNADKHNLVFTGLSPRLNPQTITVTASGGATILSITSKTNFLKEQPNSPTINVLNDSLKLLTQQKEDFDNELKVLQSEQGLINKNQQLVGSNIELGADEVIKMSEYYSNRLKKIYNEQTAIKRKLQVLNLATRKIQNQLRELNAQARPTSEIYVSLTSKSAINSKISIRYIVDDAGWSPIYDLVAGKLNEPINLKYRALAYNNSGVDWEDINIVLSTADPYQSATQPSLTPWRLNNNVQKSFAQSQGFLRNSNLNNNFEQNVNQGAFSDGTNLSANQAKDGVNIRFETVEISELNTDFEIEEKYSIPSDRKPYSIDITNYDLKANYKHYAVPKIDKDAFLLAQVTGWEELDLIPGPMNVYHGESYIGLADLNTQTLNDTLDLSLGRDKNVVVTRVKLKDLSKKQFLGSNMKANYAYKISVKNNHPQPINLELQDQVPISNNKEIEVTLKNTGGAQHFEASGLLKWQFNNLPTGKKESVEFAFEIKHPRNMQVNVQKNRTIVTPRYF